MDLAVIDIYQQMDRGVSVITGTQRLSRHLSDQYAAHKLRQGLTAWPTPPTASWDEWTIAQWRQLERAKQNLPNQVLLDEAQEMQLWEKVIADAIDRTPDYILLQSSATARAALDTWRLMHDWHFPLSAIDQTLVEDTQAFHDWAIRFQTAKENNGWICLCELNGLLRHAVRQGAWLPQHPLLLFGFDSWAPARLDLISELELAGAEVERAEPPRTESRVEALSCLDRYQEFGSAAQWSRELLARGDVGPIGIIVDDLAQHREQLDVIFDQVIHSAESLSHESDRAKSYHISLGKPLSDYPIVGAALNMLHFLGRSMPVHAVSGLLRTPFSASGIAESQARAVIDLSIRKQGSEEISMSSLIRQVELGRPPANELLERLRQAQQFPIENLQCPSAWARVFTEWLSIFGWPGERKLNSVEFQTVQAWRELLSRFARLNIITPELGLRSAIDGISRMAGRRVFQALSDPAPVQVMGVLEASGMRFTHLWITGMSDDAWPPPLEANPFLPYELQRRFNLPGAVAELELERYQQITDRLIGSAGEVVVSFPRQRDEQTLNLSGLYGALSQASRRPEPVGLAMTQLGAAPRLEMIEDTHGPGMVAEHLHGGAGIFKDQAACPFRAFAHHRVRAGAVPDTGKGLNAAERGSLAHAAIAEIWREIESREHLLELPQKKLEQLLRRHIDGAITHLARRERSTFRREILNIERERLLDLLQDWLRLERKRAPFRVRQVEQKIRANFAGIDISLRIDRLDELGNGQRAIIDYKTGRSVRVEDWLGSRPEDPQLPLYLLSVAGGADAIAFAHMRKSRNAFKGLARRRSFATGIQVRDDWAELERDWRQVLTALAEQFKAGLARVDPKNRGVCKTCDVMSLCRFFESDRVPE